MVVSGEAKLTLKMDRFAKQYTEAQKYLDSEVLKDSSPYVPMRTGVLMQSGIRGTVIGSGEVVWDAPYARRLYYGKSFNFHKGKHPKACAFWFEAAKAVHKNKWIAGAKKLAGGG